MDFADPTFILTNYGMVVACLPEDREQEQGVTLPQAPLDANPYEKRPQGGRPLASTGISTSDASTLSTQDVQHKSDTDTDIEALMDYKVKGSYLT